MLKKYIQNPKPVIWGDIFRREKGESNEKAIERCYLLLLELREERYKRYSDVAIEGTRLADSTNADDFVTLVRQLL